MSEEWNGTYIKPRAAKRAVVGIRERMDPEPCHRWPILAPVQSLKTQDELNSASMLVEVELLSSINAWRPGQHGLPPFPLPHQEVVYITGGSGQIFIGFNL